MAAEKAIQEALAEPEQKPMSWYMAAYYDGQIYMPKEPPTRKPLTESELSAIEPTWPCDWKYEEVLAFVRAIEQAHGIGGEP